MADRQFVDADLAELYDLFHPWEARQDFGFYLPLLMKADSVLDVGCGTGALFHAAREAGHSGRLCGLDPGAGMLEQATKRSDIEWVLGELASVAWEEEFDLAVMTGHAFQALVEDDEVHASLRAIRSSLKPDGRFIFETRNPLVREWENWTPDKVAEIVTAGGEVVRMWHHVDSPVVGDVVHFTTTFESPSWDRPRTSESTLRFLDRESLYAFVSDAGMETVEQYGDWDRQPLTATSPEVITTAKRV
jgi:ubiquinone/menaquinone biosynthesis C-methylase UbiE